MLTIVSPRRHRIASIGIAVIAVSSLLLAGLFATPQSCTGPSRPDGFHTPNVAWGENELGLVWLHREGRSEYLRFARSEVEPLRIKGDSIVVSKHAQESDPPLIAFSSDRYLLAWTHGGDNAPGLYVREVKDGRLSGNETLVVEGDVRLCRQMVVAHGFFILAWTTSEGIHLGRLSPSGQLQSATTRLAQAGVGECRLASDGDAYRLLFRQADNALQIMNVSASGEVLAARQVEGAIGLGLSTDGDATLLLLGQKEGGARIVRLGPNLKETQTGVLASKRVVRDLAVAKTPAPFVVWSETKTLEADVGQVYYGKLSPELNLVQKQSLVGFGGRQIVNTQAGGRSQVAFTWNTRRDGGTVNWGLLRSQGENQALLTQAGVSSVDLDN